MDKLSIIVPAYNASRFLSPCLSSILNQEYENIEVIVIDDGSTDCTGSIIDRYARQDERVRAIHKENGGVSKARNLGIEYATGEWLSFVDADDMITPDYAITVMSHVPKADLIFFSSVDLCPSGNTIEHLLQNRYAGDRADIEKEIVWLKQNSQEFEFYGYTWNKIFRTDIIKKNNVRFREDLAVREDEIFTSHYVRHINSLATISPVLYKYRFGGDSLTVARKKPVVFEILCRYIEENTCYFTTVELQKLEYTRCMAFLWTALNISKSNSERIRYATALVSFGSRYKSKYDVGRLSKYLAIPLEANSVILLYISLMIKKTTDKFLKWLK